MIKEKIVRFNSKKSCRSMTDSSSAFTIVELLVVIVVIGILAAITIASFSGVSNKAIAASLQSDLNSNANQLKMYHVEYDVYPSVIDDVTKCPTAPIASDRYCLRASSGSTLVYSGGGQSFSLSNTKNGMTYVITENGTPEQALPSVTGIAAISGSTIRGQTLTAGDLTPSSATATYQWQSSATSDGIYINISGATSTSYTLTLAETGKYIKVIATGSGGYTGSVESAASSIVTDTEWLTIGTQTWAKYNLNVGTRIAGASDQTDNATVEKYCYGDVDSNCTTNNNGGIYQWDEAMQYVTTEGAQGICPLGSHIPTDTEWKTLEIHLGMTQAQADATGYRGDDQGTQLKIGGSSGFEMPILGYRGTSGTFGGSGTFVYLWTSTQSGTEAWLRGLYSSNTMINRGTNSKPFGISVRCIVN